MAERRHKDTEALRDSADFSPQTGLTSLVKRLATPERWSLKMRFLYLTGAMLLIGSVFQVYFLSYTLSTTIENRAEEQLRLKALGLRESMQGREQLLMAQARAAASVPEIQQRLAGDDRQALLSFAKPYADGLSVVLRLDELWFRFYDTDGLSLAETERVSITGEDFTHNPLLAKVLHEGAPESGLLLLHGRLQQQAVAPVQHEGRLAGAVSVTLPLEDLLEQDIVEDGTRALLLRAELAPEGAARAHAGWVAVAGHGEGWQRSLNALKERGIERQRGDWFYRLQLLHGLDGRPLGGVLLGFDSAQLQDARLNRVYQLGGLFVSGALLLWAILFFNLKRVETFLSRLKRIIIASHSSDFSERFESDHVHCLEVMNCHNEECPVYVDPTRVCYLETGSEAISPLWRDTCVFLNKYDSCTVCPVYHLRKGDELTEMRNVVNTMMRHWSRFLSRVGHLLAYVLRSQEISGQIPSLDEVSKRLEQMARLTFFSHDLQGTLDKEEVYAQLANVFRQDFNLGTFVLFEVDPDADRILLALDESKGKPLCKREVLLSSEVCRAKRVSEDVASFYNPALCPYFNIDTEEHVRCCLPMVMGGHVGAVFSFVVSRSQWDALREGTVPVLRKYLDEAAPVLSSLRLLRLTKEQALRDPLTHCHNRRFLDEFVAKFEPLLEREERNAGLVMADLDHFKQVNDEYGHEAGDLVLKQVVSTINDSIRRSDLLVRYGGEEFLVLLLDVESGKAEEVAEKIRSRIEMQAFELADGVAINKTISLGVAEFPRDADSLYKAIKYSDVALYEAKNRGRNRVERFRPEMWDVVEGEEA